MTAREEAVPCAFTGGSRPERALREHAGAGGHGVLCRAMTISETQLGGGFTPTGCAYIRRGLDMYFSTLPTVAEGFQLRTRRTGPHAGQPKVPPAGLTLMHRGRAAGCDPPAAAVDLYRGGDCGVATDDGRAQARRPDGVRPYPSRTWHRRDSDAGASHPASLSQPPGGGGAPPR